MAKKNKSAKSLEFSEEETKPDYEIKSEKVVEVEPEISLKEEVKEATIPEKIEILEDTPVKPCVPLRVFIAASNLKWDQMAGFKSHAKRLKMGPMSISDWRKAFDDFMGRPVS